MYEEAVSSHEACSNHVYKEDILELELTLEKCISTEPLITADKAVGKHTTTRSVRTEYPLYVLNKLETTETCKNDLKVKWPTSKRRNKAANTDFTFQPNTKVQFVSPKDSAVVSVIWKLPLTMKVTNFTILRRQVKVITHLTQANNRMKV